MRVQLLIRSAGFLLLPNVCLLPAAISSGENPPLAPVNSSEVAKSIDEKRAQIAALQVEIAQLERQLAPGQKLEIEFKMYEVQVTKLRRLGVDWASEIGTVSTQGPATLQIDGDRGARLMRALLGNQIARMASNDVLKVTCGQQFTVKKGREYSLPSAPDGKSVRTVPENEIVLTATPRSDGTYGVTLISKCARQLDDKTFQIGGKSVPAVRIQANVQTVELRTNRETLVGGGPSVYRTESIRTEDGDRTEQVEIETYYSILVKDKAGELETEVRPVSAVAPLN